MASLDLSGSTVLLVEDVVFIRDIIHKLLNGLGRPDIVQAADGQEALDILKSSEHSIDYVISDFNMPKVQGLELLKAVRLGEGGIDRALPFAMLTAYSDVDLVDAALNLDVNAFLIKPVSRAMLAKRFQKLVRAAEDPSWLKPPLDYSVIEVSSVMKQITENLKSETKEPEKAVLYEDKNKRSQSSETGGQPTAAKAPRFFNDGDLAGDLASGNSEERAPRRFSESDLAGGVKAAMAMPRMFKDSDLRGNGDAQQSVSRRVNRIINKAGSDAAACMFETLDNLVDAGRLSSDQLLELIKENEAQEKALHEKTGGGSRLKHDIYTVDEQLFLEAGTLLVPEILAIIIQLDKLGILSLKQLSEGGGPPPAEDSDSGTSGSPSFGPEQKAGLAELRSGQVLARELRTKDGRVYMGAGVALTAKTIDKLEVAQELGHIGSDFWVADPE